MPAVCIQLNQMQRHRKRDNMKSAGAEAVSSSFLPPLTLFADAACLLHMLPFMASAPSQPYRDNCLLSPGGSLGCIPWPFGYLIISISL